MTPLSLILAENHASFQKDVSGENTETQRLETWWKERMQLDKQLGTLIRSVEDALGPWKLLFLPAPLTDAWVQLAKTFLHTVLSTPQNLARDSHPDPLPEIVALFLRGVKRLSSPEIACIADLLGRLSPVPLSKEKVETQLKFLREMKQQGEATTPVRASVTTVRRRSSRIHRMRSSHRIQPVDAVPFMTPLQHCGESHTPKLSEALPQFKTPEANLESFRTPQRKSMCNDQQLSEIGMEMLKLRSEAERSEIDPVLLVMDFEVQQFPWESLTALKGQRLYRLPCLCLGAYLAFLRTGAFLEGRAAAKQLHSAFYVLDPEGDLHDSRLTFQDWFESISSWTAVDFLQSKDSSTAGSQKLIELLQTRDVFLFFGHNCGEALLHPRELRRHVIQSMALLMGCSSGKLKSPGEGSILEYLAAGSVCCIGNLWAVSDAEINRFSKKLIETWMQGTVESDVAASVGGSRSACRLRFLVGAAPVTYGIPTPVTFAVTDQTQFEECTS